MAATPDRTEHGVSMWGAPGSGKTTFLGALSVALARQGGDWRVVGADQASTEVLTKLTTALTSNHTFPAATQGIEHYHWVLRGMGWRKERRRWFGTKRVETPVAIGLDLVDAQGGIAGPNRPSIDVVRGDLIKNLEQSRGIIFLFDPIREFKYGDAYAHTIGVINDLAHRMNESLDLADGRLPHYLAVCVTKFDEAKVLATAEKLDLLVADAGDKYGFPRVDDTDAEELCQHLCDVSSTGTADLMLNTLKQHFRPERIKYFVTSAIGFHVDQQAGLYNPDDYQNLIPDPKDQAQLQIRGTVHPINVVEPVMWLTNQLTGKPGR